MKKKNKIVKFSIFLRAGNVDSGPPLSTILGNYGVNTANFCKDFNEATKLLPNYFLVQVNIVINTDRSYTFLIEELSVAFLLKLVAVKTPNFVKGQGGLKTVFLKTISIRDIYLISIFKFGSIEMNFIKTICAIIISSNYFICE